MSPPKITDPKKADMAIEMWEDKLIKLNVEYGETLSSKMKVAVLYTLLPKDLQEKVLDKCAVSWDKVKETDTAVIFGRIKEEVKNIAKSSRDMTIPEPMEVDKVKAEWDEGAELNYYENEDNEVCTVGKGKGKNACFVCGKFGHRAAECWNKGGVKGQKGKGKGWQKGWSVEAGSLTQKGKDRGWQKGGSAEAGTLTRAWFGCGSTDHLLRGCPNKTSRQVQEILVEEQSEILFIGHTEVTRADDDRKKVEKRGCGMVKGVENGFDKDYKDNGFGALMLVMKQVKTIPRSHGGR